MKYAVSDENATIEFSDQSKAISYAISIGQSEANVSTIPDDLISQIPSSSLEAYYAKLDIGYPIPNTPYHLAMRDNDRAQFTGMLVLIKELLDKGYINGDTPQSIKDKNENIIDITTDQFRSIMIGYGMYYKQIWDECAPIS